MVFFEKLGLTLSLNKLKEGRYRLAMQKPSAAQSCSVELSQDELEAVIGGLINAASPGPADTTAGDRAQAANVALRTYAIELGKSLEAIDREIQGSGPVKEAGKRPRLKTRLEYLELLVGEDLEEVLAGKLSISESLAGALDAAGPDDIIADDGDSLRA